MSRPRVLVADEHRLVSEGLKRLLADDFELVGMVEDGRELVLAAKELQPDVAIVDYPCRASTASTPWRK
jgi:DNA-binding NarL/FixJ family response regulator